MSKYKIIHHKFQVIEIIPPKYRKDLCNKDYISCFCAFSEFAPLSLKNKKSQNNPQTSEGKK